jgi:UPF0271 protein
MRTVDLNADLGEGEVLSPLDVELLDIVTSASLACGFHAGNRAVMRAAALAAVARGVTIGAHVSFRDREGSGRRAVEVSPAQLVEDITEQCATLDDEVAAVGGTVRFVKPHGALYNLMGTDPRLAGAVVEAVARQAHGVLVAQAGTVVSDLARRSGVHVVPEGFPDRGYLADGRLVARSEGGALVDDPATAAERAVSLVVRGGIAAAGGGWVAVEAQTLCIHGDEPDAALTADRVRSALEGAGVTLRPFAPPVRP